MLGQPEWHGCELSAANWSTAAACARELAGALGMSCEALLSPSSSSSSDADASDAATSAADDEIAWSAVSEAMQVPCPPHGRAPRPTRGPARVASRPMPVLSLPRLPRSASLPLALALTRHASDRPSLRHLASLRRPSRGRWCS